jgi:hypothetical protein
MADSGVRPRAPRDVLSSALPRFTSLGLADVIVSHSRDDHPSLIHLARDLPRIEVSDYATRLAF